VAADFGVPDPVSRDHPESGKFFGNLLRQRNYALSELGINFANVELNGARFNEANLARANLTRAELTASKIHRGDPAGSYSFPFESFGGHA
jgi:uncharacterized protein YjbI with pentapeptide repeats